MQPNTKEVKVMQSLNEKWSNFWTDKIYGKLMQRAPWIKGITSTAATLLGAFLYGGSAMLVPAMPIALGAGALSTISSYIFDRRAQVAERPGPT